jgi:hypothetical protein
MCAHASLSSYSSVHNWNYMARLVGINHVQFAKTPAVLRRMNVGSLQKTDQALEELRRKRLAD